MPLQRTLAVGESVRFDGPGTIRIDEIIGRSVFVTCMAKKGVGIHHRQARLPDIPRRFEGIPVEPPIPENAVEPESEAG